jgi:hypothetical protein
VYILLVLCTMLLVFKTVCLFCVPYAHSLNRMLGLCTICLFSVPYARFMYHMLVLRIICLFCVSYARSVYRMLGLCTIYSFCVPYARFMYHMLVLCTVCSVYVPYARAQSHILRIFGNAAFAVYGRRYWFTQKVNFKPRTLLLFTCVCVCPLLLSWLLHLSILSVNKMGRFFPTCNCACVSHVRWKQHGASYAPSLYFKWQYKYTWLLAPVSRQPCCAVYQYQYRAVAAVHTASYSREARDCVGSVRVLCSLVFRPSVGV